MENIFYLVVTIILLLCGIEYGKIIDTISVQKEKCKRDVFLFTRQ
jgi:hypothetical protein